MEQCSFVFTAVTYKTVLYEYGLSTLSLIITVLEQAKQELPRCFAVFSASFNFPFVLSYLASSSLAPLASLCHSQNKLHRSTLVFQIVDDD